MQSIGPPRRVARPHTRRLWPGGCSLEAEGCREGESLQPSNLLCFEVTFLGYARQYDEWLAADRLRSKLIVPKAKEGKAAKRLGCITDCTVHELYEFYCILLHAVLSLFLNEPRWIPKRKMNGCGAEQVRFNILHVLDNTLYCLCLICI